MFLPCVSLMIRECFQALHNVVGEPYSLCGGLVSINNQRSLLGTFLNVAEAVIRMISLLMPVPLPKLPCQNVASDLVEKHYFLVIDYFLRYIEVAKLNSESSTSVIKHMKS